MWPVGVVLGSKQPWHRSGGRPWAENNFQMYVFIKNEYLEEFWSPGGPGPDLAADNASKIAPTCIRKWLFGVVLGCKRPWPGAADREPKIAPKCIPKCLVWVVLGSRRPWPRSGGRPWAENNSQIYSEVSIWSHLGVRAALAQIWRPIVRRK